jgi:hypothetical protein
MLAAKPTMPSLKMWSRLTPHGGAFFTACRWGCLSEATTIYRTSFLGFPSSVTRQRKLLNGFSGLSKDAWKAKILFAYLPVYFPFLCQHTFSTNQFGANLFADKYFVDQDQAMANAIGRVFLETIHRLCRWHMLNKHTIELSKLYYLHKGLEEKILIAVNHPLTPLEFENAWQEMVSEHGLQNDPTLRGLYEHRSSWIAAYFKGIFCGTITSTQRSESTNRMVKRYHVDKSTPLHMFARRMYQMLQRRKYDEGLETVYSQV